MRVSVMIGEKSEGGWEVLALPDKAIEDQKRMLKSLIVGKGVLTQEAKRGRDPVQVAFKQVLRFDTYAKRARF